MKLAKIPLCYGININQILIDTNILKIMEFGQQTTLLQYNQPVSDRFVRKP